MNRKLIFLAMPVVLLVLSLAFTGCPGNSPSDSDPDPVDKTALQTALNAANTAKTGVTASADGTDVSTAAFWVTQDQLTAFNAAIAAAQAVYDNADANQAAVNSAATMLGTAAAAFTAQKQAGTKAGDNPYTVSFDKNSGDTEASPQTKTVISPATTIDTLPGQPTRTGYTFIEWNTAADGAGTAFTETTPVTADITVYAKWQMNVPGIYVVTFNSNGGDTEANPQTKPVISPVITIDALPGQPTRTGYTFTEWNTAAAGTGTAFTEATPVTENITVYAKWQANTYTVTFNKNGGDTEASPPTKTVTSPVTTVGTLPTPPTKTGYTFTEWNTAATGTGTVFTESTPVTGNITVYARWTIIPGANITLSFTDQGAGAFSQGTFTIKKSGTPQTKTITLTGAWDSQTWYVGVNAVGTGDSVTLNAANYSAGFHTISVTVQKGSGAAAVYWSKAITFTVEYKSRRTER
jgi:uncharacterized repeat protein (TIGR02543 family)